MKFRRVHLRLIMTPRARPITMFKSKRELVSAFRDIIIGAIVSLHVLLTRTDFILLLFRRTQ